MRSYPCTRRWLALAVAVASLPTAAAGAGVERHLVACAPGYPGSPTQAQPTLDAFAAMVADASGWAAGSVTAEYTSDEQAGVAAIAGGAALTIVPTAFFLAHGEELELRPIVQAVQPDGEPEVWSLVAPRGRIHEPADLAGWELTGVPGYAPEFVRGVLRDWGALPDAVQITFTDRVLGAIRRALDGDKVAVLLDRAQADALPSLPDADALEIVARSGPVPPLIVAAVDGCLDDAEVDAVRTGLLAVADAARFAEVLESLRLSGFAPVDRDRLAALGATEPPGSR